MNLSMYDIITKKKRAQELTTEEIDFVVKGFTDGTIPDYQMSAFLMAVVLNKMNKRETFDLTNSMVSTGDILDLSRIKNITADKHSTGGVGDKTSLIVGPIVASAGVALAKMSGRGLGHTGGTLDKLEAIPGFQIELPEEEFINQVNKVGMSIISQSKELAPADKKMYALRDVTATVDNISLIASSIMSKKLAAGAKVIVLDVKCGSGAFMKSLEDAKALAKEMVDIGKSAGRKMYALLSDMNQPLGTYVGNRLEVYEAVKTLKGEGTKDLEESCIMLSALILMGAGIAANLEDAKAICTEKLANGEALKVFKAFVEAQHGDTSFTDDLEGYISEPERIEVFAGKEGFVSAIDTESIGMASLHLGGGRVKKEDDINPHVGLKINVKVGDKVDKNTSLATMFVAKESKVEMAKETILKAYSISDEQVKALKHFYGFMDETEYHEF